MFLQAVLCEQPRTRMFRVFPFMTSHFFQFQFLGTVHFRRPSWLNTFTFFRTVNKHVPRVLELALSPCSVSLMPGGQ